MAIGLSTLGLKLGFSWELGIFLRTEESSRGGGRV